MATLDRSTCALCAAILPIMPLTLFLDRTRPFVETPCLCAGRNHRPLMTHDHTREGCAGYAWQLVAIVQEGPYGDEG